MTYFEIEWVEFGLAENDLNLIISTVTWSRHLNRLADNAAQPILRLLAQSRRIEEGYVVRLQVRDLAIVSTMFQAAAVLAYSKEDEETGKVFERYGDVMFELIDAHFYHQQLTN